VNSIHASERRQSGGFRALHNSVQGWQTCDTMVLTTIKTNKKHYIPRPPRSSNCRLLFQMRQSMTIASCRHEGAEIVLNLAPAPLLQVEFPSTAQQFYASRSTENHKDPLLHDACSMKCPTQWSGFPLNLRHCPSTHAQRRTRVPDRRLLLRKSQVRSHQRRQAKALTIVRCRQL
jgi:protease II